MRIAAFPSAKKWVIAAAVVWAAIAAGGCASNPNNIDPLEGVNRVMYGFNEGVDRVLLKPATDVYEFIVPEPLRQGIGNGFANLGYANVILNDFLQGDWDRGWQGVGRMAVNSTIGIAGIFDVATEWGLPANRNDFGVTLGKWGSGPGPYLVLPLLGPSSGRDAVGYGTVVVTNPIFWLAPGWTVTVPLGAVRAMDARSQSDAMFRFRDEAAIDPYIFTRDAYLQFRAGLIEESPPEPDEEFYEEWDEESCDNEHSEDAALEDR